MNFATLSAVGGAGTHFVTTGGQLPMAKLQQNVTNTGMQQVVSMMGSDGVQYVRTLDGTTLQAAPQLISVPITLPGAKPGDPQPTVQIQVLNPNILQQQQPKYQMQIPIQGLQQGAVLTVAYSPDANDGSGIQLLGNALPDGLQLLTMPHEMQLIQPAQAQMQDNKEHIQQQIFITQNQQQLVINSGDDKTLNNNNTINNNNSETNIIIKQECDDNGQEDESSHGTETIDGWQISASSQQDLVKYLNQLPPQQTQALPPSLQQFLRLNPTETPNKTIEIEVLPIDKKEEDMEVQEREGVEDEQSQPKKRKKSKKKASKPARPKPGQVVIATAADGSVVYCCPECDNAYPEKEQLEMHLIVHKIERRFICGICGAGLKRKEHLERHKLGHNPERPYVCNVCWKGFKRREHLNLHTVIHSGVKTEMCGQCGKGFYRKDHLRKHTRSHETRRARDEAAAERAPQLMPEITIQVPTSENMQVPVQISIPQHVVTSLAAARAHEQMH